MPCDSATQCGLSTFLPSFGRSQWRAAAFFAPILIRRRRCRRAQTASVRGHRAIQRSSLFVSCISVTGDHHQRALHTFRTDKKLEVAWPLSTLVASCSSLRTAKPGTPPPKVHTDARLYLLRGLFNVISLDMDKLKVRLVAMGFEAEDSITSGPR